jgi:hypothetical protein
MIRIVAWDIVGGEKREVIGEFESVQMTGKELRDPDGNEILIWLDYGIWLSQQSGNEWYEWTVEAV